MIKFDLNTEKGQDYATAVQHMQKAVELIEKHGGLAAQILTIQLCSRAIVQRVKKKQVVQMVKETYDWVKGMQHLSGEEIVEKLTGEKPPPEERGN